MERNSLDNIYNTQGEQLLNLCIASQLRILNGRFVGDLLGNMTCFKPKGCSVVDYALTSVDLIGNVNYFQTLNPTYLSDHSQIVVHLNCHYNKNFLDSPSEGNAIDFIYKWEEVSKKNYIVR